MRTLKNDFTEVVQIWNGPSNIRLIRSLAPLNRRKRQVVLAALAVLGVLAICSTTLFSHGDLLSISTSAGTTDKTVQLLQDHETSLSVNERSLKILNNTISDIYKVLLWTREELGIFEGIVRYLNSYEALEGEVVRLMDGLHLLAGGQLSPALVSTKGMKKALKGLQTNLEARGFKLLTDNEEDVFALSTSWLAFANNTVRVLSHVPAFEAGTLLNLYELVPTPLAIGDDRFLIPHPDHDLLAINEARTLFTTMSRGDLANCHVLSDIWFCWNHGSLNRDGEHSCLYNLYNNNMAGALELCGFAMAHSSDNLAQLLSTQYLLYQFKLAELQWSCSDSSGRVSFKGLRSITVPPGCRVESKGFSFSGSLNLYSDPMQLQIRIDNLTADSPIDFTALKAGMKSMDAKLALVGSKQNLHIRDIISEYHDEQQTRIIRIGLLTFCLVCLFFVACLCLLRLRHFSKRHRNIAVRLRTEPPETIPLEERDRGGDM